MLSHDNLARHTLHHQELDVKRDFVQEYLESLEPSAAPELDPERSATTQRITPAPVPSLKTKGSGEVNSKTSQPRQRHHHHHLHHNHHHNQEKGKKGKQHDNKVPSSPMVGNNNPSANVGVSTHIESTVPKQAPKKKTQDNPTTNDSMKRKDVSKARQDNTKHKKKRKKQTDDVELDVEKLDINALYDVHNNALQQETDHLERIDTRTTAPEKGKPTVSSRKRASKITHHRDGLHGKRPPEQPHSDERQGSRYRLRSSLEGEHSNRTSDRITHLNRHSNSNSNNHTGSIHNRNNINNNNNDNKNISNKNSNNNSNSNNNRKSHSSNKRNKHYSESSHHLAGAIYAHNEDQDEKESRKKDSKKPHKILTQDSLLLNQFASANTTKGRITLPNASSRLGLFQKGKASLKTAVQDHGRGFSETNFLGQAVGTPVPEDHDRPQEVVTSSYFAKPKDGELTDPVPSPMSENRSGFPANVNTTNTMSSRHQPTQLLSVRFRHPDETLQSTRWTLSSKN
ncbi:hypothetical protein BGZ81_008744 [Podila clonocystis]|nr:hypothetical protein BGZ81_008744 [Podila clonocystis]